jgi:ubiquinone/menaquinone biosynthesis C-methylase UbiE
MYAMSSPPTMANTKHAEKEYLARTGSSEWERVKPFSQPGADTLIESSHLLHDFAAALLALRPGPDDLILDLGAGGCWCSDLLRKVNRRSIAVDISWDMLRAGRSRPDGAKLLATAGDMEHLPFRSAAFDKAVCLNAIHHVPDIRAAVREIARVLTDTGIALFSEPGKGHADAPVSTAAMRDFGVLEQEILIADFMTACQDAGFREVRLKPMFYVIPEFDLTLDQWQAWSRLAESKRPIRALRKIRRGMAEIFGFGKQGQLFEDAFGISVVRLLRGAMEAHPVIIAAKSHHVLADARPYAAVIEVEDSTAQAVAGQLLRYRLRIRNNGQAPWHAATARGVGHVTLGIQLLDAEQRLIARDHGRVPLPHDVAPAGSIVLSFESAAPATPGRYHVKFDMVAEGVTWFEPTGSHAVWQPLLIVGQPHELAP